MSFFFAVLVAVSSAWDYEKHGAKWSGTCSDGTSQSPINIKKSSTSKLGGAYSMEVFYYGQTVSRSVVNNGNYIYIKGDFGYITVKDLSLNSRSFLTEKIVFHTPSEHYLEGFPTHMELQIFHKISDSDYTFDFPQYAVVSVMLRPGDESYFFNSIEVSNLPKAGKTYQLPSTANVNLLSIVQSDDNYFFYSGSLNEPDCEENYLWYVFETEQWISFEQISYFQELFLNGDDVFSGGGNTREIQELKSRVVYYSYSSTLQIALVLLVV